MLLEKFIEKNITSLYRIINVELCAINLLNFFCGSKNHIYDDSSDNVLILWSRYFYDAQMKKKIVYNRQDFFCHQEIKTGNFPVISNEKTIYSRGFL